VFPWWVLRFAVGVALVDFKLKSDPTFSQFKKENVMFTSLSPRRSALVVAHLMFAAVLLASVSNAGAQTTFDPAADFEGGWTTNSNPNGVWSYRYSPGIAGPVTLYDYTQAGVWGGPGSGAPNTSSYLTGGELVVGVPEPSTMPLLTSALLGPCG
jgi:hypothetical protein